MTYRIHFPFCTLQTQYKFLLQSYVDYAYGLEVLL